MLLQLLPLVSNRKQEAVTQQSHTLRADSGRRRAGAGHRCGLQCGTAVRSDPRRFLIQHVSLHRNPGEKGLGAAPGPSAAGEVSRSWSPKPGANTAGQERTGTPGPAPGLVARPRSEKQGFFPVRERHGRGGSERPLVRESPARPRFHTSGAQGSAAPRLT